MKTPVIRPALAFLVVFLLATIVSHAQDICGFDKVHNNLLKSDARFRKSVEGMRSQLQSIESIRALSINAPVLKIPVVVHIVHNGEAIGTGTNISDAQIQSAITSLTQYYRGQLGAGTDAEIEFELAKVDTNCAPTTGIVRVNGSAVSGYATNGLTMGGNELAVKNLSRWPAASYYNIWVVSEINNNNGGLGIQGFAYFPGMTANLDGTVILYNAFGYDPTGTSGFSLKAQTRQNKTLTHEMGHALSLYHTFQGDDFDSDGAADGCPPNASCNSQGDEICDTDPHVRSFGNCHDVVDNPCMAPGTPYGAVVHNYMDYSAESCQDRFTPNQVARMRAALQAFRAGLPTSRALQGPAAGGAFTQPASISCAPVTSPTGLSNNFAGVMDITIGGTVLASQDAASDGGYVNGARTCLKLVSLVRGNTYPFSVSTWAANREQVRAWIDFNNDSTFDNATEQIFINTDIADHPTAYTTVSGSFNVPANAVLNRTLRMRVLNDLSSVYGFNINNACYNPTYGQAEDYPVFITAFALPAVLDYFNAAREKEDVLVSWKAVTENDLASYVIERSFDGTNFTAIKTLAARRNNGVNTYSYLDRNNTEPVSYYRLRQIDKDGKETINDMVLVKYNAPKNGTGLQVLNNPFTDVINIRFGETGSRKVSLQLTDLMGRTILSGNYTLSNDGMLNLDVASKQLQKGIYLLKIQDGNEASTIKLMKE